MSKSGFLLFLVVWTLAQAVQAEDFRTTSKITQLAGDVSAQPATGVPHPAHVDEPFITGDQLTTGPSSRAELTAADSTVIRVGSNSIFSFNDQSRQMTLQQGSVLFHTPHGQGGGVIRTAAVTAAVTGSTVSMSTTSTGGAKVVPLESPCTITGKDGRQIARINPGQMLALLPGGKPLVVAIDLGAFVRSSGLVNKFSAPLDQSVGNKIQQNVEKQQQHEPQKTGVFLFDNGSFNSEFRPPPQVQAPKDFPAGTDLKTITFNSNLIQAFQTSLTLAPNQLNVPATSVYPLVGTDITLSPMSYIQSLSKQDPSTYFTNLPFSDTTLATFGITPALPGSFTLPPGARQIVGLDITLGTVPYNSNVSGLPGDPDAADLSAYRGSGLFGLVARRNFLIQSSGSGTEVFSIINAPDTVMLGAGGTFDVDGSRSGLIISAMDTRNLIFGSVGAMTLNGVSIYMNSGNFYAGSLTSLALNNFSIYNISNLSMYSGGGMNITGNFNATSQNALTANLKAKGDLNFSGNASVYSNGGTTNLSLTSTQGSVNFTGTLTLSGSAGANFTIDAAQNAYFTPSSNFSTSPINTFTMNGYTVYLDNVSIASSTTVNLHSADHGQAFYPMMNGGSVRPGSVNIGGNVMSGGTTVTQTNLSNSPNIHVNN